MSEVPTCPGYCCEAFNVGSPEEFRERSEYQDPEERDLLNGLLEVLELPAE